MANEHVPSSVTIRSDDQILLFNAWVPIGKALTASADVPSSFTVTTETTSTLPPPPPPPQQSIIHLDIWLGTCSYDPVKAGGIPKDNLLVSVEVLRYDAKKELSEKKGIVPMELVLE
ncbi:hypothetical protein Tco_1170311 [Tanacetum coccineum]